MNSSKPNAHSAPDHGRCGPGDTAPTANSWAEPSASSDSEPSDAESPDSPKPTKCTSSPPDARNEHPENFTAQTTSEAANTPREYVLSEADFVLISTPLGPATQSLIGAHELSLMKPTAYIINPASRPHRQRTSPLRRPQKPHHRRRRHRHLVPIPRRPRRRTATF